MYKKILALVDDNLISEISARYALTLAKVSNSKFFMCYIAQKDMPAAVFKRTEDMMNRLFLEAKELNMRAEAITETGVAEKEISIIVKNEGISILFKSTINEDIKKGSRIATRFLRLRLPCSIALVSAARIGKVHPKNILVPLKAKIDNINERAFFTAKMAEGFGSKVLAMHVAKPLTRFFHGERHLTPAQWEKRTPEDISRFIESLKEHKVDYDKMVIPGAAARSITLEAALRKHDLIIMGATARSAVASILKDSPVSAVLRETPCDLIILKPGHRV